MMEVPGVRNKKWLLLLMNGGPTLWGDEAAEVHRPSHGSLAETIAANRQRKDVSNDMLFIVLD